MTKGLTPPTAQTIGGSKSKVTAFEFGFFFSRQSMRIKGRSRDVVAVWRPSGLNESPVFVAAIGPRSREAMLGCAVLALAHLGVDRPRIRSIQRVAGVMQRLSLPC